MTATKEKGLYPKHYLNVLYQVLWDTPKTQSNFARGESIYIAEAASRGHISSIINGSVTNSWSVTTKGKRLLKEEGFI